MKNFEKGLEIYKLISRFDYYNEYSETEWKKIEKGVLLLEKHKLKIDTDYENLIMQHGFIISI